VLPYSRTPSLSPSRATVLTTDPPIAPPAPSALHGQLVLL
jgi:hypothetical protein